MSSNILKADNGVSSGTTGLVYTAGNDGTLQLATTTSGGTATTAITIDNSQKVTFANTIGFGSNAGITFNNSSALTNSTLNDYETGTWTPTDVSGAGLTITNQFAFYTKIGNMVFASCDITYPSNSNGSNAQFSMPFVSTNYANGYVGYSSYTATALYFENTTNSSTMTIANSNFAQLSNATVSGKRFIITMVYKAQF